MRGSLSLGKGCSSRSKAGDEDDCAVGASRVASARYTGVCLLLITNVARVAGTPMTAVSTATRTKKRLSAENGTTMVRSELGSSVWNEPPACAETATAP